ncbi:hypothetical protein L2E82_31712 [Cichorium intybus]|uniref:Uncharacterized protein n=1 Tax=Cichorium intybus TaxID=13427 RepID=A0ACB9BDZ7_CICIN|nr:hypothetical protein L2E82_31712 [Cichorium intybus]
MLLIILHNRLYCSVIWLLLCLVSSIVSQLFHLVFRLVSWHTCQHDNDVYIAFNMHHTWIRVHVIDK